MRIIKFRAWDTVKKKMWSAEEMGQDELTLNPDGRGFVNVHGASTRLSIYCPHMVPLQYSGLKDKNEKEIYEGDVVKGTSIFGDIAEVRWCSKYTGFGLESNRTTDPLLPHLNNNLEVIGNIYENPELLKQ